MRSSRPSPQCIAFAALALASAWAGVARAGSLGATPGTLDFPPTATNATSTSRVSALRNNGAAAVTVTRVAIAGADAADFSIVTPPPLPLSLNPTAGFDVEVVFAPKAGGARTARVEIEVMGEAGTTDVLLTGTGIGPKVAVEPAPITMGGLRLGQTPPPVQGRVTNAGGAILRVQSVTTVGPDAAAFQVDPIAGLPIGLGEGMGVPFTLRFTPTRAGKATASLRVASDDPATPELDVEITGYAGDPKLALDVGTIIFGKQRVAQASPQQDVTITNEGFSDLHVTSLTLAGPQAIEFDLAQQPALPLTLAVGESSTFAVTFTPSAVGLRAAQVRIASDDPAGATRTIEMTGVGTTPLASAAPPSIDFQAVRVGMTGRASVTVANMGTGPMRVTSLAFTGAQAAQFSTAATAPLVVAAGASATIPVVFTPAGVGSVTGTLTLVTDDPALPMFATQLSGSGVSPVFAVTPRKLDFGGVEVGEVAPAQPFEIKNTGNLELKVTALQITGSSAGRFSLRSSPRLPLVVPPGGSVPVDVEYSPFDASSDDAQINLATDDPKNASATVLLSGIGLQAGLTVSPEEVKFGPRLTGTRNTAKVTLQNTGDAVLVISSMRVLGMAGGAFTLDTAAPVSVAEGRTATFNVLFTPPAVATYEASLEIESANPGIDPVSIPITGSGLSPNLTVAPTMIDFAGVTVADTSSPQVVTITNGGTRPLVIEKVTPDSPVFVIDATGMQPTLAPGMSTTFAVLFAPQAEGDATGSAQVFLATGALPAARVALTGVGVAKSTTNPREVGCAVAGTGSRSRSPLAAALVLAALGALIVRRRR